MKNYQLFCICLLAFIFTTCHKEENLKCTEKNTIKVIQHARDFFYFKQGSWWVYEEETTKLRDSIWVEKTAENTYVPEGGIQRTCNCGWGKCEEKLGVRFVNKNHNKTNNDRLFGYGIMSDIVEEGTAIRSSGGHYFSLSDIRLAYDKHGNIVEPLPFDASLERINSMQIEGKTYEDIIRIYYQEGKGDGDWLEEGFFAKNIHLIKYRRSDSTTWNLVKYNIVK